VKNKQVERFWEIDLLRGIAIVGMILFHTFFDLNFFNVYPLDMHSPLFLLYMYTNASLFIVLVGISLSLSYTRAVPMMTQQQKILNNIQRGFWIFGLGLVVTAVTWLYIGEGFILFGALHCIGISIILASPFLVKQKYTIVAGSIILVIGIGLIQVRVGFPWLLWLGLRPYLFYTVDYFPLFPWFGIVLLGIALGRYFYPQYTRRYTLPDYSNNIVIRGIRYLGRHSLLIYFLHQPLIIGIITLLSYHS
jgi:uncharacterized membrane protein